MKLLEEVDIIFENLRESLVTENDAQHKLKEKICMLSKEDAKILMKKLNKYQYENVLKKTVYTICTSVYELVKEYD